MAYPSFNIFKGCIDAIFAIEKLRDKHFKEAIEPYVDGHLVPTLGDSIVRGLVRMLTEEFNDTESAWLDWWLYETTREASSETSGGHGVYPLIAVKGKEIHLNTLEALYKLLTGGFDE